MCAPIVSNIVRPFFIWRNYPIDFCLRIYYYIYMPNTHEPIKPHQKHRRAYRRGEARRISQLNLAVSEEEAETIRKAAAAENKTIADWAVSHAHKDLEEVQND